jgi:hypothetical protein
MHAAFLNSAVGVPDPITDIVRGPGTQPLFHHPDPSLPPHRHPLVSKNLPLFMRICRKCHPDAWVRGRVGSGGIRAAECPLEAPSPTTQIPHSHLAAHPSFGMTRRSVSFSQTRRAAVARLGMTPNSFCAVHSIPTALSPTASEGE